MPVLKWLIAKLKESRDIRGQINRKQGLLNYNIYNQLDHHATKHIDVDPAKLNEIVFLGKPKRVYKANRSTAIAFNDAKRVHTALREFNDLSANAVFQNILHQIESMDGDDQFKDFGKVYQDKKKGHKGTIAGDAKSDFFKEDV